MSLTEKDIGNISKGFTYSAAANKRIIFMLYQTNLIKSMVHWVQDFHRINRYLKPDVTEYS